MEQKISALDEAHGVVNTQRRLFVYGTLCDTESGRGWGADATLDAGRLGTTPGLVFDYHGCFPYAKFGRYLDDNGDVRQVVGQVFTFDTTHPTYIRLDRVECSAGYRPRIVAVTLTSGMTVGATAYECDSLGILAGLSPLASGDWNGLMDTYEVAEDSARYDL